MVPTGKKWIRWGNRTIPHQTLVSNHNHDLQKYLNRRTQRKGRSMKEEEMHGEAMLQDWMQVKEGRGRVKQIKQS